MYSFNLSIHDDLTKPCQIMPRRQQGLYDISSIKIDKTNPKTLIHTSYITHVWQTKAFQYLSTQWLNLDNYFKLAQRIGAKYVLIHGPKSPDEYKLFATGLNWLHDNFDKYSTESQIKLVIEIPSFTKKLHTEVTNKFEFIDNYLQLIVTSGFDIVLDTAHLYANGLNCDDMIKLIDKYKPNFEWIHLNGNCRQQFTSDVHVFILDQSNKFYNEADKLLKHISKLDNCICILETIDYKTVDTSELTTKYDFKNVLSD